MRCANDSSVRNMQAVLQRLYAQGGPSLGLALVTYATRDIWDYTAYSLAINQVFAEHNGYIMRHLDPATSDYDKKDARWNKVSRSVARLQSAPPTLTLTQTLANPGYDMHHAPCPRP